MMTRLLPSSCSFIWLATVVLVASLGLPAAEAQAFQCSTDTGVPPLVRAEGQAERVGDVVIDCWGGTPTAAGQAVPQVNITVTLDTFLTSAVTNIVNNVYFTEALLLVDEPNSQLNPAGPILNCGNTGAPDAGPGGAGICSILGGGAAGASATYNGTAGHPNAFQGRLIAGETSKVLFASVPIDPPGNICPNPIAGICHRYFRVTNLRGNATVKGVLFLNKTETLSAAIVADPPSGLPIDVPVRPVARIQLGLRTTVGEASVHLQEGFTNAWKPKNVSFYITNGDGCPAFHYVGGTAYPPDAAQNASSNVYDSESGFQWQNNSPNGPLSPDLWCFTPQNIGNPLNSVGYGGANTGIATAGVANSGTRIALRFDNIPPSALVQVPQVVQTSDVVNHTIRGVMVRTNTDSAGAGAFSDAAGDLTPVSNLAVYEVLFANPSALESADIPFTVVNGPGNGIQITVRYAPFYSALDSGLAGTTYPVPRFLDRHFTPSKVGIFRSSFFVTAEDSNGNIGWDAGIDLAGNFGIPGDQIFFGDWDGSGTSKMGIFRPSNGLMALDMNGNLQYDPGVDKIGIFGQSGDIAIVGDWSGDGKTKVGIYRPSTSFFALDLDGNLKLSAADKTGTFGAPGDVPIVGDWTGDGRTKVGIFRNGTWALDMNGNILFDGAIDAVGGIGQAGDVPLLGDWNGDGRTKVGIYRANQALFGLDYNGNLSWDNAIDRAGNYGIIGDVPVVGDWDGTGVTRVGVYRTGIWALDRNGNLAWDPGVDTTGGFGSGSDQPIVGKWQ